MLLRVIDHRVALTVPGGFDMSFGDPIEPILEGRFKVDLPHEAEEFAPVVYLLLSDVHQHVLDANYGPPLREDPV